MNNAEYCKQCGIKLAKLTCLPCADPNYEAIGHFMDGNFVELYRSEPLSPLTYESVLIWLDMEHEHVDPILTSTEREYLGAFIKPFRNRIITIEKDGGAPDHKEFLYFHMKNDDDFCLPDFPEGSMYKGMKTGIAYSLKELYL